MLGSGALVVVAEGTDLLALAANVTKFFRNESCGKCVPCRVGSEKAVELLDAVLSGKAAANRARCAARPGRDDGPDLDLRAWAGGGGAGAVGVEVVGADTTHEPHHRRPARHRSRGHDGLGRREAGRHRHSRAVPSPEAATPVGVCRMCVVDVGGRVLAASCVRPCEEGMKVETASPKVEKQRKMLTALLLADHPTPCAKERTTGDDELDALGRRYGLLRSARRWRRMTARIRSSTAH